MGAPLLGYTSSDEPPGTGQIAGEVLDRDGYPLAAHPVRLTRILDVNGARGVQPVDIVMSNANGQFSFVGLTAGRFEVEVRTEQESFGVAPVWWIPHSFREEFTMGRTRPTYPPEFRLRLVELVRAGRSPASLAREFEPTARSIQEWVRQADRDEGHRPDGLTTAEREELRRLRRENRRLREERTILEKAAAWFARETGSIPSRSSDS